MITNVLMKLGPYALLGWLFSRMDCDLTLWFYSKLGKSAKCLKGKVTWITGASSGIGEALAYELARNGSKLIISGTRVANLEKVKAKCLELNTNLSDKDILVLPFDVKEIDRYQSFMDQVLQQFGQIDILVNNAGRTQRASFEETDLAVDRDMFEVNVFGMIKLTRLMVKHWYETNHPGQIVVSSSAAGKMGAPYSCTYTASKHALHGYFESLRNESYHRGIRITMVCPGPVFSEIITRAYTGDITKTFQGSHKDHDKRMTAERCAYLMSVAIANQLTEVWISINPILLFFYTSQYLPAISRFLGPKLFTKEKFMKMRDGTDS